MASGIGSRSSARGLWAVVVGLLAAGALVANIAYDRSASDVTASHLTLVFVAVACVLPLALIPVRRSAWLGRADGQDIRLPGSAVVPVSAIPLAVAVACAGGHARAAALAVVIATVAAEVIGCLVSRASGPTWWRAPVLAAGRLVLLLALLPITSAVTARSAALLVVVPAAFVLDYLVGLGAGAVLRRAQGWDVARPVADWRSLAARAGTGVLAGAIWVALVAWDPVWAPSLVMAAWILLALALMWQRDLAVARAMRVITTASHGLSDLLEAGDLSADAARDAFLLVTARTVGLACTATSVQLVINDRASGGVAAGLCLDDCRSSRSASVRLRAEPATALRVRLPHDDAWSTLTLACWDALGSPLPLRRHAEAVGHTVVDVVRDGRHALRTRDLRDGALADLLDPRTTVVARSSLGDAFDSLVARSARHGDPGVVVLVARLADPSGAVTALPPRVAAGITQTLVRRLISSQADEDVALCACATGSGRVVLLAAGTEADRGPGMDRLLERAAATDSVIVTDDGVTALHLLVGGAVLGPDGHDLGDLIDVAEQRSIGEVSTPRPDPWPTLAVALATRALVHVPAWMFAPGPAEHLLAALLAESDRAGELLIVPLERPVQVAESLVEAMQSLGTRVGLPLDQVSLDHPLRPWTVALVIRPQASAEVLLAAVAIARSADVDIVTAD